MRDDDGLGGLTSAARRAAERALEASTWDAPMRAQALAELDEAARLVAAARVRVLAAADAARDWARSGDRDLAAWHARTTRDGAQVAGARARAAALVAAMPAVDAALGDGRLTEAHVAVLARTAARATPVVAAALADPRVQDGLVAQGARLDAREYARAVERWVAAVDPPSDERDHAEQRANRSLWLTDSPSGTHIKGVVDAQAGKRLRLALEALSPRPGDDDDRTPEQRRADALAAMADHVLSDPGTTPGALVRPHVSVVLSERTWLALCAGAAGVAGVARVLQGVPPVRDEDGALVPPAELARLLCDAQLTRIVVDAAGVPVDLGRTQRLFTNEMRRALVVRDGGCAWNGCGIPARWTEGHHLDWWGRDGGGTSVENGVLLCAFHHHLVHAEDLRIVRVWTPPPRRRRALHDPDEDAAGSGDHADGDALAGEHATYEFRRPDGRVRSAPPRAVGREVDRAA
ncbi:HNH endonuclease signature motif containing protein [Cellulomonas composti]|uniref:HNH nuclease domain-containing protein n=1 Tax=Cellulomonas composti TaxID=266130 RepID=A0A511JC22_9CELL|nr:HNH endonuclease signature motif containing protein [Cellulomonas composti]GEL95518.1 hypothetical protein CCO02nite_21760 [Cellulomonas composti]